MQVNLGRDTYALGKRLLGFLLACVVLVTLVPALLVLAADAVISALRRAGASGVRAASAQLAPLAHRGREVLAAGKRLVNRVLAAMVMALMAPVLLVLAADVAVPALRQTGVGLRQRWQTRQVTPAYLRRDVYFTCKRLLDIVVAVTGLVMLSPLMVLIGLLVVLDSPGPAIFTQDRVGAKRRVRKGKVYWEVVHFNFYKFRTMRHNADTDIHKRFATAFIRGDDAEMDALQDDGAKVRKLTNDPRVTRLGKWLRKSSLDELPQLWNILKGEMTLVGPRPAIPYEVEVYQPWQRFRLQAVPGLTGLWQVTARSSVDFDEMVRLDIQYIEQQSIGEDMKLLLKTPLTVLAGDGAV